MTDIKNKNLKPRLISYAKFAGFMAILIGAIYIVTNFVPLFANNEGYVIVTDSMEPTINVGDYAIVNTHFNVSELNERDIIAFYTDLNDDGTEEIVIHYIAQITENAGNYSIRTVREDADETDPNEWDDWTLTGDDILGVYNFKVPVIGNFMLFLGSSFGKFVIIIDILVIFFVIEYFKKEKKKKQKEIEVETEIEVD